MLGIAYWERGRRIVNSVNSPSRLSTSIVPPCCWVTMSGDRQAEAGAFAGRLCCNKGLKQLFWTSGAIPVPLSRPGLWQNGSTSLRPKLNTRALSFVRSRCRMPV